MIATASIVIGLVLTVCNDETQDCEVYVPKTYNVQSVEKGMKLCNNEYKNIVLDVMSEDKVSSINKIENSVYVLNAECTRLEN